VDVNIVEAAPIVCDTGPHAGQLRVDFRGSVYLTGEEAANYPGRVGLSVILAVKPGAGHETSHEHRHYHPGPDGPWPGYAHEHAHAHPNGSDSHAHEHAGEAGSDGAAN
jgi:hypothetical protein